MSRKFFGNRIELKDVPLIAESRPSASKGSHARNVEDQFPVSRGDPQC